jgi:hypothetical protein
MLIWSAFGTRRSAGRRSRNHRNNHSAGQLELFKSNQVTLAVFLADYLLAIAGLL